MGSAQFDREREDHWPRQWAEAYVRFAATEKRDYLRKLGLRVAAVRRLGRARRRAGDRARQQRAPLPHHLGHRPRGRPRVPGAGARGRARRAGCSFAFRHQVDELIVEGGAVSRRPGHRARARATPQRGVKSSRAAGRRVRVHARPATILTSGGIGHNHELIRRNWPVDRLGPRAGAHDPRRARPRRRPNAPDRAGRRREPRQPRPDVALRRGDPQLGSDLARSRDPHHPRPLLAVARCHRPPPPAPELPRRRHPAHAAGDPRHRLRLLVVRPHPVDHREGVQPLRLRAEPRHHRQGPAAAAQGAALLRRPRTGRGVQGARQSTSSSPTSCRRWSTG